MNCAYFVQVWKDIEGSLGFRSLWEGHNIEACFLSWFSRKELEVFQVVPYLVLWGIWLARNASLFEDTQIPSFKVSLG
jgi:hypothetical protein